MRSGRFARGAVGLAVVGFALAAAPERAPAYYGNGATIVSASLERLEQGDDSSTLPAISRDGRYVAFQTRARNLFADGDPDPAGRSRQGGVFRRDMATGQVALVADGDVVRDADNVLELRGARNPSISATGRYVVFSTVQKLVVADTNDNVDVYVRDMERGLRAPGAYELASAKKGGDVPASYEPRNPPLPGRNPGTEVFPRGALSGDGRTVVLRTVEQKSDLPDRAAVDAPGGQLLVRDLDAKTTRLLTTDRATGAPAGGAFGPASISGDSSAVAWTGQNAPTQTPFLQGEIADPQVNYYLYKRIADGPAAPTRRVTGAADLDDPACPPGGSIGPDPAAQGPCYGPLTSSEQGVFDISQRLPSLSDDGWTVAFVTAAGPRPNAGTSPALDAWVTSMRPGVSRKLGSRELTRDSPNDQAAQGPVDAVTVSGDARYVALTSTRTRFLLPGIVPVGTFRAIPDTREVYLVDRGANTIERVARAYTGADSNSDAASGADLAADGSRIAFGSAASNLFFGDANERADIFTADRTSPPTEAAAPQEAPPPSPVSQQSDTPPAPTLRVTVRKGADGLVTLLVRVPSAGALTASARARLPVSSKKTKGRKKKPKAKLETIASARATTRAAGTVVLPLRLGKSQRAKLGKQRTLTATARIDFAPKSGAKRLKRSVKVTFSLEKRKKR